MPGEAIGGKGGAVSATIAVTPGEVLQVMVGGRGGFNGGGSVAGAGGSGGGASDIRRPAFSTVSSCAYQLSCGLAERLLVAGGGGGRGTFASSGGGDAGQTGTSGANGGTGSTAGAGGTADAGGAAGTNAEIGAQGPPGAGSLGTGGGQGWEEGQTGGSGGGGYYGGGGGGAATTGASGGGGGSSWAGGTGVTNPIFNDASVTGDGVVTIDPPSAISDAAFNYTGSEQNYTVPTGVTQLAVRLRGGVGGRGGANGLGRAEGDVVWGHLPVTPAQVLKIVLGGSGSTIVGASGYNGGGATIGLGVGSIGGGGASDIRLSPYDLADRVVVAGGGGGSNGFLVQFGWYGASGGAVATGEGGSAENPPFTGVGQGGLLTAGGQVLGDTAALTACAGSSSGIWLTGGSCSGFAGGGGGYYGGAAYNGGGGGSSYASVTGPDSNVLGQPGAPFQHAQGGSLGDGAAVLTAMPIVTTGLYSQTSATEVSIVGTVNPEFLAASPKLYYDVSAAEINTGGGAVVDMVGPNAAPILAGGTVQDVSGAMTGLTAGTTYYYRVCAQSVAGLACGDTLSLTTAAPPGPPTAVTATAGNAQVTVSWTVPASDGGAAIINYDYSLDDGATWTAFSPAVTASPATITGLTNGTTYQVKLRAVNSVGAGAASAAVSVTIPSTVTFNSNGGTGTMTAQTANVATNLTTNTFTRAGYTFAGWNTVAGGGGTAYADGASYAFTADVTLYAQWTALPTKTVTFNSNGGTGTMTAQTTNVATNLTTNTFTRAGYTFSGWNTVAGGGGTAYADGAGYAFTADVTLYAQWTALPTKTVTFNSNGGTGTMTAQTANVATNLTTNTFTRAGYTFAGWNTVAGGGGTAYADGASYAFTADVTLYAQWTALPTKTVTFNSNGGTGTMTAQTANVATNLTTNTFTRAGYTFAGWNTVASGGGTAYADGASYAFTADVTLYAQWSAVPALNPATQTVNGTVGTAIPDTAIYVATGFGGAVSYAISPALPAGLSLSSTTGVISGTPTATQSATTHTVTGTGATSGTATATVSLSIGNVTDLPILTTPGLANAVVGIPYAATLGASGGEPPYTYTGTGLPAGLSLSADGVLSGIPTTPGPATVVITVTDRQGQTGQRSYTMQVETTVAVATASLINGLTGAVYQQTLAAVGGKLPYAWSLINGTLPAGLNLNPGTGLLSGTPTVTGAQTFTVQVRDSLGQTATQALTLTIQAPSFTRPDPVNPSLPLISAGLTVNPGAGATCTFNNQNSFTFNLGQNGVPVAGPPGVQLPNGLVQIVMEGCTPGETTLTLTLVYPQPLPAGTQVWKYGPTAAEPSAHWYVMPGAVIQGNTVTYTVRDGGLGDDDLVANGTILDPAGPGIPTLNLSGALPASGQVGATYSGTLTATAGIGPYVWSVAAGTLPAGLSLATPTTATTTVSGTPTQAGTFAFTIQVVDQGNGNIAAQQAFTAQIAGTQATPTVTLSANPGAPAVNQATTITATVTAPSGTPGTPTGSVVISGGGQSCTATLSNGTGSCPLTYASAGNVALTGAYSGDANFTTASGNLTLSIGKVATTTALTSAPNPAPAGQAVTLTATVSAAGGTPSGTVTFAESGTAIPGCAALTLSSGTATCTTSTLTAGSHALTADYSGDAAFAASAGAVTQTVNPGTLIATTTVLTSAPNPAPAGQAVTLTATVSAAGGTPTGTVAFQEGNTVLGTGALAQGSAGLTVSTLTAGSHALTAVYSGDPTFAASQGAATQTVTVTADIPTLSEWAMLLLTVLLGGLAWRQLAAPTLNRRC